jgi:hypothetical protein
MHNKSIKKRLNKKNRYRHRRTINNVPAYMKGGGASIFTDIESQKNKIKKSLNGIADISDDIKESFRDIKDITTEFKNLKNPEISNNIKKEFNEDILEEITEIKEDISDIESIIKSSNKSITSDNKGYLPLVDKIMNLDNKTKKAVISKILQDMLEKENINLTKIEKLYNDIIINNKIPQSYTDKVLKTLNIIKNNIVSIKINMNTHTKLMNEIEKHSETNTNINNIMGGTIWEPMSTLGTVATKLGSNVGTKIGNFLLDILTGLFAMVVGGAFIAVMALAGYALINGYLMLFSMGTSGYILMTLVASISGLITSGMYPIIKISINPEYDD